MKILFTDLDGTLLDDNKDISQRDFDAINGMIAQGHKFVVTTGRPLVSAKRIAEKYGFVKPGFYLVSFNGGRIYDCESQKAILTRYIPVEEVKAIMDAAHACGMHAHTYSGDLVVSEYETEQLKTYCRLMQMDYVVVKDIREYYDQFINVSNKAPVIKQGRLRERVRNRRFQYPRRRTSGRLPQRIFLIILHAEFLLEVIPAHQAVLPEVLAVQAARHAAC